MLSIRAPQSRFSHVVPHWYGLQAKNGLQAVLMRSRAIVDVVITSRMHGACVHRTGAWRERMRVQVCRHACRCVRRRAGAYGCAQVRTGVHGCA